jgi:transposase InsO family protein
MEKEKIQMLKQYLMTLKISGNTTNKQKRYLEKESINYTIYKDNLYRYNITNGIIRKVLNQEEAEDIIHTYHQHPLGGHLAYNNTLHKIATRYFWEKMSHDIQEYIKKCPRCQMHGSKSLREELYPVPVSTKPFDRIALDVKHVQTSRAGYRYIIVGIDYLTKYVEARPMRFQTSSEIALFLYEEIICRHGCPTILVSDNGKPFLSDLIRQVCRNYSIIHKTTTPYNPQSNGLIERFNRTLGQILQRRDDNEKKDWDQYLPAAIFAYRSMKQATTKQSPFFLLYGYEPKTPFDMKHQIYEKSSPKFEATLFHRTAHQIHNLNRIREQATKAIKTTQTAQKKAIENKLLDQRKELKPPFNIGDIVLLYKDYLSTSWSGKLQDKWEGPYIIQNSLGKGTYHIKSNNVMDTKIRRVHGNRLKPYSFPNTQWRSEQQRVTLDDLDDETKELFD